VSDKSKRALQNVALLVSTFAVMLLLAEAATRLLYRGRDVVLFPRYHTDAIYGDFTLRRIRPNAEFWHTSDDGSWKFVTNKQGFRNDKDFSYTKSPGVIRVMTVGDSQTQGYEVRQDYTYSAVIEKYLRKKGYQVEVMNTGVSGFSTAEALLFLENEGIKYAPDIVVLGFFANDLEDNIKADLLRVEDNGNLIVHKKAHVPGVNIQNIIYRIPLVQFFSENSYFYSLLFNNVWEFFKAKARRDASQQASEYAVPTGDKVSNYQFALASAIFQRMFEVCHRHNAKLIVLDIPQLDNGGPQSRPSVTGPVVQTVEQFSDAYIASDSLLADYQGVMELHVAHGHRHIAEFTHGVLGVAVAKRIEALVNQRGRGLVATVPQ
jgi:lysophospholipase L1-like esterase